MMRATLLAASAIALAAPAIAGPNDGLGLSTLAKIGTVDERYQSYNIEMVEVTGGRFWAPFGGPKDERYRMRPPLDLAAPRIRALARQLGPAYVRVSGTWANNTYLLAEGEKVDAPPAGYAQVLQRDQWRGVVAFARAVDARLVTSFAASIGTRGPDGVWKSDQAQRFVDLTREAGGSIYGAEFFNEPNLPMHGNMPEKYGVAEYTRDFAIFRDWARKAVPEMKITGPGSVAEGSMMKRSEDTIKRGYLFSEDLLQGNPNSLDIVSYHYYGGVSARCGPSPASAFENVLKPEWLDKTLPDAEHYGAVRDRFAPGKPLWLNETAQAACGGSPWASTFADSFRYLNQLGLLAQKGVQVVAHNTLAASDYALVDYDTMMPRPNYWAAVLWRRTMGSTVLASPQSPSPELRLYAHCLHGKRGGVGLLAINTGAAPQRLNIGSRAVRWTMTAAPLDSKVVSVNGTTPALDAKGRVTGLQGASVSGALEVPGQAISFVAVADANNKACR